LNYNIGQKNGDQAINTIVFPDFHWLFRKNQLFLKGLK